MGLIILGAENLASDQADQNPNTSKRSKEFIHLLPWIEIIELPSGRYKAIFHDFEKWPTGKWNAVKNSYTFEEIDMSSCSMTTIGKEAFKGMRQLKTVALPPALETIENEVFYGAGLDVATFTVGELPETLKTIGNSGFNNCQTLELTKLPGALNAIGDGCFSSCMRITVDKLPETLASIGGNAFEHCSSLWNMEVACPHLPQLTFAYCDLRKVWLRSTCIEIGVTDGGHGPFLGDTSLEIYAEPASKPEGWEDGYNKAWSDGQPLPTTYNQTTSPF